jgi:hypothetical protein
MRVLRIFMLFFITGLFFISPKANATHWELYADSKNKDTKFYYDSEVINYLSKFNIKVWEKVVYVTPERKKAIEANELVEYTLNLIEIDCIKKEKAINLIVHYGTDGVIISFCDYGSPRWTRIPLDSTSEILYKTLCSKKSD